MAEVDAEYVDGVVLVEVFCELSGYLYVVGADVDYMRSGDVVCGEYCGEAFGELTD